MWRYFGRNVTFGTLRLLFIYTRVIYVPLPPPNAKNSVETQESNLVRASLSIMDLIWCGGGGGDRICKVQFNTYTIGDFQIAYKNAIIIEIFREAIAYYYSPI